MTRLHNKTVERLYTQDAARISAQGMQQVLYFDLTVALSGHRGRSEDYFQAFEAGQARWYHLPVSTFLQRYQQHIVDEIRYLALALTSEPEHTFKQIDKLWPVKSVRIVPRFELTYE